jgi:adenosylhomocysteine nucleosidase
MKKIVGVVAAMETEISAIKQAEEISKTDVVAGLDFCVGKVGEQDVVVVQCGMGKVNAALATQILIEKYGVGAIINIGCAGGLNDSLNIGDFVISTEVVQHDYDVSAIGYKKGEVPYSGKISFEADENLISIAEQAISTVNSDRQIIKGRICSGDQFICTTEQKETIIKNFGGECAEMEGAAVGQVAYMNEVPFVIIRAMSDSANNPDDFTKYVDQVTEEGANVVLEMLKHIN